MFVEHNLNLNSCPTRAVLLALLLCSARPAAADSGAANYDADAALAVSQAAVGRELEDWSMTGRDGRRVNLADYRGKPLLISMIFTSCHHICPAITQHLGSAVRNAREALGEDSFRVVTIGFDTPVDTPQAMRLFARKQGIDDVNWDFLSGSSETMSGLVENVGFVHFPSPRGFDHINQVTLVDQDGRVYRQVYGAAFELPALVEPLKQLVFNRPQYADHAGQAILNRVRLFCTVYDPNTGRYRIDYSLFVGMGIGALILLGAGAWLLTEYVRASRKRKMTSRA